MGFMDKLSGLSTARKNGLAAAVGILLMSLVVIPYPNDIWFILSYGRHITETMTLPVTEFLTFHTDYALVIQQWLFDVIAWWSWVLGGPWGVYLLTVAMSVLLGWLTYKRLRRNGLSYNVTMLAMFVSLAMSVPKADARPSGLSTPLLLGIALAMDVLLDTDASASNGKRKRLLMVGAIGIMSCLLSNVHASMVPFAWLIVLAYVIGNLGFWEAVGDKVLGGWLRRKSDAAAMRLAEIEKEKEAGTYVRPAMDYTKPLMSAVQILKSAPPQPVTAAEHPVLVRRDAVPWLLACLASSIACSFINPYGAAGALYTFHSTSPTINAYVFEMRSVPEMIRYGLEGSQSSITAAQGTVFFCVGALAVLWMSVTKSLKSGGQVRLEQAAIAVGLTLLTLMHFRGVFILSTIGVTCAALAGTSPKMLEHTRPWFMRCFFVILSGIILFMVCILNDQIGLFFDTLNGVTDEHKAVLAIQADPAFDADEDIVYADYDNGGYLEFHGMRPYMDPRAEVFFKSVNGVEDLFDEFISSRPRTDEGMAQAAYIAGKYDFDYIVTREDVGMGGALEEGLIDGYELLEKYQSEGHANSELGGDPPNMLVYKRKS